MSFFVREIIDEEAGNYFELTGAGYGALIAVMVIILVAACFLSGGKRKNPAGSTQGSWYFPLWLWRSPWSLRRSKSSICPWEEALLFSVCFLSA